MRATIKTTMRQLGMKNIVVFALGLFATSMVGVACTDLTGPESPETPVNVTATLLTGTSARIEWQASPQSDGVISYNILRNGTKVGESPSTSFTDVGLAEQTKFEYSVSANCLSGLLSDASPVTAASTITTADVTPPRVTAVSPLNGSVGVSLAATATVQFSEDMNPATVNTTTFNLKVTGTGALIPGTVVYTPATKRAEFKPDVGALPSAQHVTVTVTNGAKDLSGNALSPVFTSSFTTRDEEPPRVIATNPTNGAGGVSSTAPNIAITFSEPLDASTVNSSTITLQLTSSGELVPGTVAYIAATPTATFTPTNTLTQGTSYTVTVASSVKDVAGNALGVNFTFTFTTGDTSPPVLIVTTPANLTTGVATNSVVTAAFNEAMDPNTINGTTFTVRVGGAAVAGTVTYNVATATATFTPTAALAPSTAYIATVTTGAKDLAGNALVASVIPNPWTFTTAAAPTVVSTTPADLATNVPTNTTLTATFSDPMDGTTITTGTFQLRTTVGSTQVTGVVTYNAGTNTATFTPSSQLTGNTAYTATITAGAKNASGTALAGPFSWTFSTVDNVAPTVTGVTPSAVTPGVAPNTPVNITFSEAMDATTITATTITLKNTSTSSPVTGSVAYNATTHVATFTPSGQATGTGYTVTVTTGVKDVAGNAMAAPFTSTYQTAAAPDNTAPTVISVSPANNTNAPPNTKVYITFSEPMDPATINGTTNVTLRVTSPSAAVAGTLTYVAGMNMAIFSPTSPLTASTGYTITVTTGVKDVAGNALASQFTSPFATTAGADAAAPTVTAVSPTNGVTGVSVNSAVTVTFSEGMDPTTINGTAFTLKVTSGGAAVAGTIAYNSNLATFTPTASLQAGTNYTVTVTTGAKDLAQNAMAAQFTSTFTTAP